MAELDIDLTLYEMNKQIMSTLEPMTEADITREIAEIATWFSYEKNYYFMLLCRERDDYTIIHFLDTSKRCYQASQELLESLRNRGEIISIAYEPGVFPIWLRIDGESFLYHLFPYDTGVIEV